MDFKIKILATALLLLIVQKIAAQTAANPLSSADEAAVRQVTRNFVDAWLRGNEADVMALCDPLARLSPGGQCPIDSLHNMRDYWFPKDGSVMTIHRFDFDILSINSDGDKIYTSQKIGLNWSYSKGETRMHKEQLYIGAMVFRKQADGAWKIWREQVTVVRSQDI
jgi:ketosteroid isomerase-like protein